MTLRERVEQGAKALDARCPGWEQKIEQRYLDIASSRQCILGQVFGSYDSGCFALFGLDNTAVADYGFTRSNSVTVMANTVVVFSLEGPRSEWEELNAEWCRFLQEREAVAAAR